MMQIREAVHLNYQRTIERMHNLQPMNNYPALTRALLAYTLPADIALAYLELAQRAGEVATLKVMQEELGQ